MKRNIAEHIYNTASDFGFNLVFEGKDIHLYDWKEKYLTHENQDTEIKINISHNIILAQNEESIKSRDEL
jgi:hypothetical protein